MVQRLEGCCGWRADTLKAGSTATGGDIPHACPADLERRGWQRVLELGPWVALADWTSWSNSVSGTSVAPNTTRGTGSRRAAFRCCPPFGCCEQLPAVQGSLGRSSASIGCHRRSAGASLKAKVNTPDCLPGVGTSTRGIRVNCGGTRAAPTPAKGSTGCGWNARRAAGDRSIDSSDSS